MSPQSTRLDPILPIAELPEEMRAAYEEFVAAIDNNKPKEARSLVGRIIAYYVDNKVEIPPEFEASYMRLYLKELAACTPQEN